MVRTCHLMIYRLKMFCVSWKSAGWTKFMGLNGQGKVLFALILTTHSGLDRWD